ncbi:MAG TPA: hypothetical protein IAD22_07505, partial [Candidatus Limousia pullorum]|nr:hypothetical protein [Candidatus Limousia pullorum]
LTLTEMVKRDIIPAVTKYIKSLADTAIAKKQILPNISTTVETELIEKLSFDLEECYNKLMQLEFHIKEVEKHTKDHNEKQIQALSEYVCGNMLTVMRDMRTVCDDMEVNTSAEYWPYPSYGELMTSV